MGAPFFAERAAKVQHLVGVILEGLAAFAEGPGDVRQPLDYRDIPWGIFFADFLWFMLSTFESEKAPMDEANRTL